MPPLGGNHYRVQGTGGCQGAVVLWITPSASTTRRLQPPAADSALTGRRSAAGLPQSGRMLSHVRPGDARACHVHLVEPVRGQAERDGDDRDHDQRGEEPDWRDSQATALRSRHFWFGYLRHFTHFLPLEALLEVPR